MEGVVVDGEKCRTCGAPIVWSISAYGNRMPIDPNPTPQGNLVLEERADRDEPNAIYVGKPEDGVLFDEFEGRRHLSHFVSCPQSRQWRKK